MLPRSGGGGLPQWVPRVRAFPRTGTKGPKLRRRRSHPRFPNGLTIQDGRGQWRDSHGVIEREHSYELTLLYPASEARMRDPQIERIRDAYEKAYAQDSVARLEERTTADF